MFFKRKTFRRTKEKILLFFDKLRILSLAIPSLEKITKTLRTDNLWYVLIQASLVNHSIRTSIPEKSSHFRVIRSRRQEKTLGNQIRTYISLESPGNAENNQRITQKTVITPLEISIFGVA